jgi:hypothetical protein
MGQFGFLLFQEGSNMNKIINFLSILLVIMFLLVNIPNKVEAAKIYLISGGNNAQDSAVENILENNYGHQVDIGVRYNQMDGTQNINQYNAIIFLINDSIWNPSVKMPVAGQNALIAYINSGKGLITDANVVAGTAPSYALYSFLNSVLPSDYSGHIYPSPITYQEDVSNSTLNHGLPVQFDFPDDWEGYLSAKAGADVFYKSLTSNHAGVVGWSYNNSGRVIDFSVPIGTNAMGDPEFQQLLNNAVTWASPAPIPSSILLFSAGLFGLIGLRRFN